jgi:uncharacterized protein YecE (DUF72 family)
MTATEPSIGRLYVGASGFSYPSWRGGFYPAAAKPRDFLRYYAERLPSVEVNSTFYNIPAEATFSSWAEAAQPGFRFALKMYRRVQFGDLTPISTFCERARLLGVHLGPIRIVLVRARDDGYLRLLLDSLDPNLMWALDFRHGSWDVDEILAEAGVARVGSLEGATPFRYVRLREPAYDDAFLAGWAERLRPVLAAGVDVYCYFRHEDEPTAPAYAARLLELVHSPGSSPYSPDSALDAKGAATCVAAPSPAGGG